MRPANRGMAVTFSLVIRISILLSRSLHLNLLHHLVNLYLRVCGSVVVHGHIISIQFRHEDCGYAVVRTWNLPDEISVLKNINERNSGDVKSAEPGIKVHVVRREL